MKYLIVSILLLSSFASFEGTLFGDENVCETIPAYTFKRLSGKCRYDPAVHQNTAEIITGLNYTLEQYTVTTKDGYILTLQRIPYNKSSKKIGQPVYLQHGAASSSENFVSPGKKSLGFILSEMGYDVWLGNSRGNFISTDHVSLKTSDKAFWNYTLDDMGNYDLPATIDKIVEITKRPGDIIYIGHSQGSTIAMIYAILHSEHAAKNLKGLFFIGPVAYLDDLPIPFVNLIYAIVNGLYKVGFTHFGINQKFNVLPGICATTALLIETCKKLTDFGYGPTEEYPPEHIPIVMSFILQRESFKPIVQFIQIAKSGNFQAFDYKDKNVAAYQSETPPIYDFSKLQLPVFLFRGENDYLAPLQNTKKLYDELRKHSKFPVKQIIVKSLEGKPFNHMNFLYDHDLKELIVQPILNYLSGIGGNRNSSSV